MHNLSDPISRNLNSGSRQLAADLTSPTSRMQVGVPPAAQHALETRLHFAMQVAEPQVRQPFKVTELRFETLADKPSDLPIPTPILLAEVIPLYVPNRDVQSGKHRNHVMGEFCFEIQAVGR